MDAAMDLAASKVEMAVVSSRATSEQERVYKLRTMLDEPAWVVATRVQDPAATANVNGERIALQLRATVGRFGDRDREQLLLAAIRKRLKELCGVETSPLE